MCMLNPDIPWVFKDFCGAAALFGDLLTTGVTCL
jgi:hypothetical protein